MNSVGAKRDQHESFVKIGPNRIPLDTYKVQQLKKLRMMESIAFVILGFVGVVAALMLLYFTVL